MRIELLVTLSLLSGCNTGVTPGVRCPDTINCDDNDVCTTDLCSDTGACIHEPATNGTSCGNKMVCNAGACSPCNAGAICTPANSCLGGLAYNGVISCVTGEPECILTSPLTTDGGTSCDDGNACTEGDKCVGDTCVGAAVAIDDNLDCTVDSCSKDAGVMHTNKPENAACMTSGGSGGVCILVSDGYRHCH